MHLNYILISLQISNGYETITSYVNGGGGGGTLTIKEKKYQEDMEAHIFDKVQDLQHCLYHWV